MKTFKQHLDEAVRVDTEAWQASNGKKIPSGTANWIFSIGVKPNDVDIIRDKKTGKIFEMNGPYSAAKKAAQKEATKRKAFAVYLMP